MVLWEPYPSHHNGLFSPLFVLRVFAATWTIPELSETVRVCVFISDPFRGHNKWSVKFILTDVWDMKGSTTINFVVKEESMYSVSYCQLLRQYFTLFIEWPSYTHTVIPWLKSLIGLLKLGAVSLWGNGVAPSPTPWCSSYRKGSLRVTLDYGR